MRMNRRQFLKSATLFSAMGLAPQFITRLAEGEAPVIEGFKDDRVLVVVQLSGGNDGLNTVVPYGDDLYYRARPTLGITRERVLPLNDILGLNDAMKALMRLYDDGHLAIVQGVGYPNPDRSHFRSMEIWHTSSGSDEFLSTGWIGRYFDHCCTGAGRPQVGVAIGQERPQAFDGVSGKGVAFDHPDRYGWRPGKGRDTAEAFAELNRPSDSANQTLDFLRHTTSNAILSSAEVREAVRKSGFSGGLSRNVDPLQTVAALLRGGLQTRVFYVSMGGFDTHVNQLNQHDALLARVAKALGDFQQTLKRDGTDRRVLTLVFSEFGRRVAENASKGTDHGTAAPLFLIGPGVRGGLCGMHPSLRDLDQGDLRHSIDFRSIYAAVLEDWFAVDSVPIVGGTFQKPDLMA